MSLIWRWETGKIIDLELRQYYQENSTVEKKLYYKDKPVERKEKKNWKFNSKLKKFSEATLTVRLAESADRMICN